MATFDNLIIDSVLRVSAFDLATGDLLLMMTQLQNATLNATSETSTVTGLKGMEIARLDRSKSCTFECTNGLFVANAFAMQVGGSVVEASSAKKFHAPCIEILNVEENATEGRAKTFAVELTHTPDMAANVQVYKMTTAGGQGEKLTAETDYEVADDVVTLKYAGVEVNDGVIVVYDYEAESGIKITNEAEAYTKAVKMVVDIIARDVCTDSIYHTVLVMPRAKMDGNFSLSMSNEAATHPLSAAALPNLCSADKTLFDWYIVED